MSQSNEVHANEVPVLSELGECQCGECGKLLAVTVKQLNALVEHYTLACTGCESILKLDESGRQFINNKRRQSLYKGYTSWRLVGSG